MMRRMTKTLPLLAAVATAALLPAFAAAPALPDCFSEAARTRLADAVELEETENTLNVVYFIGADREPVADYERRISELLTHLQQYYAAEMARNGFGHRAFGLVRKPDGLVDILLVRGKEPGEAYGYSNGGADKSLKEIAEYFKTNPGKKNSEHTFVIMPTLYNAEYNDEMPGGVPFYGYGKCCFALDYAHFDIKYLGEPSLRGKLLTKWYGGFAHELGHGLNLPHNTGTVSQNAAMGTALMGAGNHTFGMKPTYITKASCAILDRSETFARKGDETAFYGAPQNAPTVSEASLTCRDNALHLSFRLHGQCDHVNAYMQDPPYVVNRDYEAVAFTADIAAPAADGSREVTLTIPLAEIADLVNEQRQLGVYFLQHDGNRFRWNTEFKWADVAEGATIPMNPEQPFKAGY